MSAETTGPRVARERDTGAAADTGAPSQRPATAEAMSVIGPLDRPARATTLYGLRLR
jgi:hypothetical protein